MKRIPPSAELNAPPASGDQNVVPLRAVAVHAPRSKMSVSNKLEALFNRLTIRQRNLILAAAETDRPTPQSVIRQIAELETAIAAVAGLWAEGDGSRR